MPVRIALHDNEACDHCGQNTGEYVVELKHRSDRGKVNMLWVHPSCFATLISQFTASIPFGGRKKHQSHDVIAFTRGQTRNAGRTETPAT